MSQKALSKSELARSLGVSRSSLYHVSKKDKQDWELKANIEETLRDHPAYGSRRLALHLGRNRKGIKRVMQKYGIKPYRRRGRKYLVKKRVKVIYPNLLMHTMPAYPHHIWATDFTELVWKEKKVYVATVLDLYTRQVVGIGTALRKGTILTLQALHGALLSHSKPVIFHSDNGSEYIARAFVGTLEQFEITISRSAPGCPWENGYQESFYDKFKIDLGDSNRFKTLGELVAAVYETLYAYNHTRIHSALKMPPAVFAERARTLLTCPQGV